MFVRVLRKVAKINHYLQNLINFHGFYVQKLFHYIENKWNSGYIGLSSIIIDYMDLKFSKIKDYNRLHIEYMV